MKKLLVFICILVIVSPTFANSPTTQQIGDFTYTDGTINGQPYHTTTQRIGSFDYTNGDLGGFGLD